MGARLLETAIVDYCLSFADPGKKLPFSFSANKRKFADFVFRLQEKNGSFRFPFAEIRKDGEWRGEEWRRGDMKTWRHGDMETWRHGEKET